MKKKTNIYYTHEVINILKNEMNRIHKKIRILKSEEFEYKTQTETIEKLNQAIGWRKCLKYLKREFERRKCLT